MPQNLRSVVFLCCALAGRAWALPPAGSTAPRVTVEDTNGKSQAVPDAKLPVLVIYEDQNAGKQNERARQVVGRISDRILNQNKLLIMAVGDLEKWNWWPARKYALKDLQRIARQENTTLYCDWKGALRRAWGLTRGKSGYLLVDVAGTVRFAGEGTLSAAQLDELVAKMAELGAK
jgi:hypothetical protein